MAPKKREHPREEDLHGFKYFKKLLRLSEKLQDAGCARDKAHNRELFMDQYVTLLLLYMFNPVCQSLRALQEASGLKKVQRALGVGRCSLGSLSEAARVFESGLLLEIIGELAGRLGPLRADRRLAEVQDVITLVDGSWLRALPKMAWALFRNQSSHKAVKAHVHFELLRSVAVAARLTDAKTSESSVLRQMLEAGRLYVLDRGYADYGLLGAISAAGSGFVCRLHDNAAFEVIEERELSGEALAAGVVRDAVVRLGCKSRRGELGRPVRIVEIECREHRKPSGKTARGGPEQGETILLVTDQLDLPAETVGLLYAYRWHIEVFFRFFKHVLGCRHLLSTCENGIELQMYMAIIACLLIALWTARRPTLSTYRMACFYLSGWASTEELLAHINKLQAQEAAAVEG
jgi:hypothetical protein